MSDQENAERIKRAKAWVPHADLVHHYRVSDEERAEDMAHIAGGDPWKPCPAQAAADEAGRGY